jgi:archaeal flagellar protein FlaG
VDKAIITVLLIIAGVVCVSFMFNAIYPAINRGSDAVVSMTSVVDDRIKTQVDVIHTVSEYDPNNGPSFWNDTNSNSTFDIFAWVKNVGTSRILGVEQSDIFFGTAGDFERIPHEDYAAGVKPYWQDSLEDSTTEWGPGKTMKVTIVHSGSYGGSGLSDNTTYLVKLIIPNGISDETYVSW